MALRLSLVVFGDSPCWLLPSWCLPVCLSVCLFVCWFGLGGCPLDAALVTHRLESSARMSVGAQLIWIWG